MKILITGGAGFIGSSLVRYLASETNHELVVLDKLTYAGNLSSITGACDSPRVEFIQGDILDSSLLSEIFSKRSPDAVMHLAAESHVDRSIDGPKEFIETNVVGTMKLLEAARAHWEQLPSSKRDLFRFHHISTDEVFGDLGTSGLLFQEDSPYRPSSPYAASKASADHLVRAWGRTYDLPYLVTNCSNNYGPYQFPEKLIPHMIINALNHRELPVYGEGQQTRDWLYVDDHVRALLLVLEHGEVGETYNIGGHNEVANIDVVTAICDLLEEVKNENYASLITFVEDRKGHDLRYAIDASKIASELGWVPVESFQSGLRKTLSWYLSNAEWWTKILDGSYKLTRLGTS